MGGSVRHDVEEGEIDLKSDTTTVKELIGYGTVFLFNDVAYRTSGDGMYGLVINQSDVLEQILFYMAKNPYISIKEQFIADLKASFMECFE